jgi:hypothetical protein
LSFSCRSFSAISADIGDDFCSLIGQFGHCNQELLNLLLLGTAISAVFDGRNDAVGITGLTRRSEIGFLSGLEAKGYVAVGRYFKQPRYPIWILGADSHITVCFSLETQINAETVAEEMLSTFRSLFKQVDGDNDGYLARDSFPTFIRLLSEVEQFRDHPVVASLVSDPILVVRLRGVLCEGDIILWQTLWIVFSRLLAQSNNNNNNKQYTVEDVIEAGPNVIALLANHNNNSQSHSQSNNDSAMIIDETRSRSDSEYARLLQLEFDDNNNNNHHQQQQQQSNNNNNIMNLDFTSLMNLTSNNNHHINNNNHHNNNNQNHTVPLSSQHQQQATRVRSDSEIARELQRQFDEETNGFEASATFANPSSMTMTEAETETVAGTPMTVTGVTVTGQAAVAASSSPSTSSLNAMEVSSSSFGEKPSLHRYDR